MNPARSFGRPAFAGVALAIALACANVGAQPAPAEPTSALERKLEQSLRMIEALSARVDALEKELALSRGQAPQQPATAVSAASAPSAAGAAASDDTTAARMSELEKTVTQLTNSQGRDLRDPGLPLHGFADVGWSQANRAVAGRKSGFALGSLDFYLTPELGKVKTLVELNVGVEGDGETVVDLERMQLGYAFSDQLTLWLGRFHTPIGYWNMAYHHGAQIQPSILRPRLLDFEDDGGILPVHTTGLWGTGSTRTSTGRLTYHVFGGNGTRLHAGELDPNPAGDDNASKLAGLALGYRFSGGLEGLALGVSGLRQVTAAYDAGDALVARTRVQLLGAYAAYDEDGWELIGEAYRLGNSDLSGGTGRHTSSAGFLHVGRSLGERWVPYARFEKASLDQADSFFALNANGRSYERHVLGVRFNADPRAALKLEWNRTKDQGLGLSVDQWRFQYAVAF